MATEQWIESAAHQQKPIMASDVALSGQHLLHTPTGTPAAEATERADAIWMNRRLANRHHCDGLCQEPEHERDVAAGVEALQALGLTPYRYGPPPPPEPEPEPVTEKRCSRCEDVKPRADFYTDPRSSDGLASHCRTCHQQINGNTQRTRRARATKGTT